MGLFSSKKKISVSSVVYNLAGEEAKRIQYLPTTVVGKILSNTNFSMGDVIQGSMLSGPGIKMRSFGRWARTSGYSSYLALQSGQLVIGDSVDVNALSAEIPHAAGQTVSIQTAEVDEADYGFWADQWMLENHPERINEDYEIDFTEITNTVYIRFPDASFYSFNPVGFDPLAQYLYVSYTLADSPSEGPLVTGTEYDVASPAEYPDTTGWTDNGTVSTPGSMPLEETVRTVVTYSDARPGSDDTVITPSTGSYYSLDQELEHKEYHGQGATGDQLLATLYFQHNMSTGVLVETEDEDVTVEEIEPGVFKTTTVTTTTQSVGTAYSYRIDTQEIVEKAWTSMQVLIYQQGTGNAVYDAMFEADNNSGDFFPFIPIRLRNQFVSETFQPTLYEKNIRAYKKATGSNYDKLVASIADNDSIGDIDYAYAVYAVSLNTKEKSSLKYVYKFFQTMFSQGAGGTAAYAAWQISWNIANNSALAWQSWKEAQSDSANPLYGAPEPAQIPYPPVPTKKLNLKSSTYNFNMTITWTSMNETVTAGLGKVGARVGDLWWTEGSTVLRTEILYGGRDHDALVGTRDIIEEYVALHWQDEADSYRTMQIGGLYHKNTIYKGKGVGTRAKNAINDAEESGFLIPLHEGILKSMSLKDSTQMSTACTYLVFNCYTVTKQKWYTSSWFKVVIIVAAILITVFTAGAGAGASAGLLGTAAAVGAALGFAGTIAIIVGTIANAIAAMILTQIITAGATALFGDKVGMIVGTIASIIAVSAGSSYMSGQSLSAGFSNLATAENIMRLTVAAGGGMAQYIGAETREIVEETQKMLADYASKEAEVLSAYEQNLGLGRVQFDPMELTDATKYSFIPEASDVFLNRTLLTGSEIASMTNDLLTNFTNVTLSTELT